MARKYDRYGRNRQFRRNPTRSPKFFPYELPFLPDFRLMVSRDTPVSHYQSANWRDLVREARDRTARRAEASRKRSREEFEKEVTKGQKQIMNAMGNIMFAESGMNKLTRKSLQPVRFFMFDEFRL